MGCKYACVCCDICPGCSRYEPEEYYGHAEDVLAQSKGFQDDSDYQRHLYEVDEARHNNGEDYDY